MTFPYMSMYWGDYLRDTTHLTTEEHGAYLLLIARYWSSGSALPDDDRFLSRVVGLSLKRWKHARPVLQSFFNVENGTWAHSRIERELRNAAEKHEAKSKNGSLGGTASWRKRKENQQNGSSNASISLKQPEPEPEPYINNHSNGAVAQSAFEDFWKVYPRRDGPNPRKPAKLSFDRAVKAGADPQMIIAAAKQFAITESKNIGSRFMPQAVTWLNQERWKDPSPTAVGSNKLSEEQAVEQYARFGKFLSRNIPFYDIREYPSELLAKHGLDENGRRMAS